MTKQGLTGQLLTGRRLALGVQLTEMAEYLGIRFQNYGAMEKDRRNISNGIDAKLMLLEGFTEQLVQDFVYGVAVFNDSLDYEQPIEVGENFTVPGRCVLTAWSRAQTILRKREIEKEMERE